MPEPLAVPHETVAVGMAHGFYLASGRPQAVMVHVNVGTANALMGLLNAARDAVPILFTSGRTPVTEAGRLGSRDLPIHWGQEMYDQGGMLREYVKWDYELRYGEQLEQIVDRALAIALTPPAGPVYLSLPREALAAPIAHFDYSPSPRLRAPATPAPAPQAIAEAAAILSRAERPLIIAGRGDGSARGFEAAGAVCRALRDPGGRVLALAAVARDRPPAARRLRRDAVAAGIRRGPGPRRDGALAAAAPSAAGRLPGHPGRSGSAVLRPADAQLPGHDRDRSRGRRRAGRARRSARSDASMHPAIEERRRRIEAQNRERRQALAAAAEAGRGEPMSQAWISRCLDRAKDADAMVFNELGCDPAQLTFTAPGCYFSHSLAGGLGWGLPAALGAQLACPDRLVIAAVGDGSYMFANPVACHQLAEAKGLPVLTCVFNNGVWNAVRKSTAAVYPDGHAVRSNRMPLSSLEPSPRYEMIVAASGGYGERVATAADLPAALERALHAVKVEKRQALLNVICQ